MTIERDYSGLAGRTVLIVEDEVAVALDTADAARRAGATVLGPVPDLAGAEAILAEGPVDVAMLDVRLGEAPSLALATMLRGNGVEVVFVTGYDDWFLADDLDDAAIVHRAADPGNVVRVLFERRSGGKA